MTQLRLTTAALIALGGAGLLIGDMGLAFLGAGVGTLGFIAILRARKEGHE